MSKANVTYYHNPRCSKSRQGLDLLRERGIEPKIVEYLQTPPDVATLKQLLRALDMRPRDLMRTGEKAYRDNRLDDVSLTDDALIHAMIAHPILIERPIAVSGKRAAVGRPPENLLEIL
jgi:arsenate reductase